MLGPFRLLLAALVVLAHTEGYRVEPDPGLPAIVAFFAISGFLMPAAFERNYADASFRSQTRRYLINRALRIFPVYWLVLALHLALLARRDGWEWRAAIDQPIIFAQNVLLLGLNQTELWGRSVTFIGPAWTLDVELQYYLAVPFIVRSWRRRPARTELAMTLLALPGTWLLLHPTGTGIDGSLVAWWPFFATGFLAWSHRAALAAFAMRGNAARSNAAWTSILGDLSYPLYLVHRPLIETGYPSALLAKAGIASSLPTVFTANLVLSLAAAAIVHGVVVRPLDRLRRACRTRPTSASVLAGGGFDKARPLVQERPGCSGRVNPNP